MREPKSVYLCKRVAASSGAVFLLSKRGVPYVRSQDGERSVCYFGTTRHYRLFRGGAPVACTKDLGTAIRWVGVSDARTYRATFRDGGVPAPITPSLADALAAAERSERRVEQWPAWMRELSTCACVARVRFKKKDP